MDSSLQDSVRQYYGETLQGSADLQTNACCTDAGLPEYIKPVLAKIHDEVLARYYGCGLVLPEQLEGAHILDLGCGAGRDVYALSALVGEHGSVTGVDMTPAQLAVAHKHRDWHARQWGHARSNVQFVEGTLEELPELGLPDHHFDVIVSNCVINLCTDKVAVLKAAWDLLKPGGELYFSDVYADRRIPPALQQDPVLYGECLSGALYWNDFLTLAKACGFADPRLVEDRLLTIENPAIEAAVAPARFYSATYRLFKLEGLEPACEDYGQAVIYRGSIQHHPAVFRLDKHHAMEAGRVFPVCGNTWRMLHDTRFRAHFDFIGSFDRHFGIFEGCGAGLPFDAEADAGSACC